MNINATSTSDTMSHFLRLAEIARMRNAGFDTPLVSRPRETSNAGTVSQASPPRPAIGVAGVTAAAGASPEGETKRVLGTRFDAYA